MPEFVDRMKIQKWSKEKGGGEGGGEGGGGGES